MRILKSTALVLVIITLIISVYNLNVGLPILFFCFGLKEFVSGKELYDEKKYKLAILSVIVGILVCICSVLSLTNLI